MKRTRIEGKMKKKRARDLFSLRRSESKTSPPFLLLFLSLHPVALSLSPFSLDLDDIVIHPSAVFLRLTYSAFSLRRSSSQNFLPRGQRSPINPQGRNYPSHWTHSLRYRYTSLAFLFSKINSISILFFSIIIIN